MLRLPRLLDWGPALLGAVALVRSPRGSAGGVVWLPKLIAQSWAPWIAVAGAARALYGLARRDRGAVVGGVLGTVAGAWYTARVTAPHDGFEVAFGSGWRDRIPPDLLARLPRTRYRLLAPAPPPAIRAPDLVVGRRADGAPLLADLWHPPAGVPESGLAVVFLHGSLWQALDKDFLTRPLFRRLAGHGHTILDVAYPLAPGADLPAMRDAVRKGVEWMMEHALEHGVRRDRIVLMGASGGGHLALLEAYAEPALGVRAVVSIYGPTDLEAFFHEYGRTNPDQPRSSVAIPDALRPRIRDLTVVDRMLTRARIFPAYRHGNMPGGPLLMLDLLGGTPDEVAAAYRSGSPIGHAARGSPPTLQVFGDDDFAVDVSHGRRLHARLREVGVPSVLVELPGAVHAFDQYFGVSRRVAPAAQASMFDVEHFLALMT